MRGRKNNDNSLKVFLKQNKNKQKIEELYLQCGANLQKSVKVEMYDDEEDFQE